MDILSSSILVHGHFRSFLLSDPGYKKIERNEQTESVRSTKETEWICLKKKYTSLLPISNSFPFYTTLYWFLHKYWCFREYSITHYHYNQYTNKLYTNNWYTNKFCTNNWYTNNQYTNKLHKNNWYTKNQYTNKLYTNNWYKNNK